MAWNDEIRSLKTLKKPLLPFDANRLSQKISHLGIQKDYSLNLISIEL